MSFFIKNKRKASVGSNKKTPTGKRRPQTELSFGKSDPRSKKNRLGSEDEEISSDSDIDSEEELRGKRKAPDLSSSEEDEETAQDKRLRLAKDYLAKLETEEAQSGDEADLSTAVADRLKQDILEQAGKLHKYVANHYKEPTADDVTILRGHQLPVTCLVISPDDKHIFSASKDCSIIKWCVSTSKKVKVIPGGRKGTEAKHKGHTAHVLCLAISTDGQFLVSGDRNKLIHVWNPDSCLMLHTFTGHRDAVSGLVFRKGTHQLFSASLDRTIKIWSLDEMAYVETLFGHHDIVTGIDSLTRERAVTSGGRDGSVRIWKVIEESQLVFHGHSGSIDCVSLINEEHFVSGADDNSLAMWGVMKKKPLVTVQNAHSGQNTENSASSGGNSENWITSVTSLTHTDLIASGSKDGCIRLWKCSPDFRSLHPLFNIPVAGFVNSLKFSSDGSFLVAGVGQEHRLGRWWRLKNAKNSVQIIKLPQKTKEQLADLASSKLEIIVPHKHDKRKQPPGRKKKFRR